MVESASRVAFTVLVVAVASQRLWELRRSTRNEQVIRAAGGREHAPGQMVWMRCLHALWIVGMLVEVWALVRVPSIPIAVGAFVLFCAGQTLRVLAMSALGRRWTVKIMTLPGEKAVSSGIFRWLRHPNYVGVALEMAALPMLHGAVLTALSATLLNGVLLFFRIRAEEQALRDDNDYDAVHGHRPRFVPQLSRADHGRS